MELEVKPKRFNIPWNKNITHSKETRAKLKKAWTFERRKKQSESFKTNNPMANPLIRKKATEKLKGKKYPNRGKKGVHHSPKTEFKKGLIPWWIKQNKQHPMKDFEVIKIHPNYKGGITPKSHLRLCNAKFLHLRKKAYLRDNFTCQACGKKGGKICAHHILPYFVSENDEIENLITLCFSCHPKIEVKVTKYIKQTMDKSIIKKLDGGTELFVIDADFFTEVINSYTKEVA